MNPQDMFDYHFPRLRESLGLPPYKKEIAMEDFFKQVEDLNRYLEWPADSEIEDVNPEVYKKIKKDLQKERRRKLRSGDPRVRNSAFREVEL